MTAIDFMIARVARTTSIGLGLGLGLGLALASAGCLDPIPTVGSDEPHEAAATQDLVDRADYILVGLGGKCMDVAGAASDNGTPVNLYDCNGTLAQRWHFSGATGTVGQFLAFGKCLDIPGANFVDRSHLQLWDCNATDAQRYRIFDQAGTGPDVQEEIRPDASQGFCVEVAGGFTDNGTPIQLFDCNGTLSQRWYAVSASQSPSAAPPAPAIQFITSGPGLQITDRSLFEDGFRWYRRENQNQWIQIAATGALPGVAQLASIQRSELADVFYEYKVVAYNAAGQTESNVISVGPPPPSAPSSVHFPTVNLQSVTIAWSDNSSNETNFQIFASSGGSTIVAANTTSTTITGLPSNTQVCFDVYAFNQHGYSAPAHGCVTTKAPPPPTTVLVGLQEFITAGGTIFYSGTPPLAGTMTKLHVPLQSPVTGVFFVKPGYSASTECANPVADHLVFVQPGNDVDLTALFGSATVPIFNPTFSACAVYSQLTSVSQLVVDVTYQP